MIVMSPALEETSRRSTAGAHHILDAIAEDLPSGFVPLEPMMHRRELSEPKEVPVEEIK